LLTLWGWAHNLRQALRLTLAWEIMRLVTGS
jgi:hypothetical protein